MDLELGVIRRSAIVSKVAIERRSFEKLEAIGKGFGEQGISSWMWFLKKKKRERERRCPLR